MKVKSVRWWITTIVVPGLMLAGVIAIPLFFVDRMPNPVARHWNSAGEPNGASPLWVLVGSVSLMLVFAWGALIAADRRGTGSNSLTAVVYFVDGLALSVMIATVWSNLDVGSWEQAAQVGPLQIALIVLIALLVGAAGWFLSEEEPIVGAKAPGDSTLTVGLEDGDTAVWLGSAESRFMPLLSAALIVGAVVAGGVVSLVLVTAAVLILFFSAVRVSVNEREVHIGFGWWGWPRKAVPLDEISGADALEIEPMAYGGWGLRGKGSGVDKIWAVIVRRGPGLRLIRPNVSDVVVTVDDAEHGAGLINDLLKRSGRVTRQQ